MRMQETTLPTPFDGDVSDESVDDKAGASRAVPSPDEAVGSNEDDSGIGAADPAPFDFDQDTEVAADAVSDRPLPSPLDHDIGVAAVAGDDVTEVPEPSEPSTLSAEGSDDVGVSLPRPSDGEAEDQAPS